jgi:spore maturation protein CgeB
MALSISQTTELWGYTSDRLYNIVATGCPALVQRFNGMDEHGFVDGKTCIAWTTFKEMVEKARFYKAHSREREEVGRAGREMLLKRHTWDVRVGELFHLIAGLGE